MKIAYVINTLFSGGAELHLLRLAKLVVSSGSSVTVISLQSINVGGATDLTEHFLAFGVKVVALDKLGLPWLGEFGRWLTLYSWLRKEQPTLVHSHLPRSDFAAYITTRLLPGIIWICTLHDRYVKESYSGHWIFKYIGKCWSKADLSIAVSSSVLHWAKSTFHISADKSQVIGHGYTPSSMPAKKSDGDVRPTIGILARYEERKGYALLLNAMPLIIEKVPDVHLVCAGHDPGQYSKKLADKCQALGIDAFVTLLPFQPDPIAFLRRLAILVAPSTTEGFGLVLLEAMSNSLPVIATNIGPFDQIVVEGVTGLLFEPGNHIALANAIVKLLTDRQLAHNFGLAGRQRVLTHFSEDVALERVLTAYRSAAASANVKRRHSL
jgi:glycosyltransferase involved in cell wall biosynthesis